MLRLTPLVPALPVLLAALLLAACFEDPVVQSVHLDFRPGGAVDLIIDTRISAVHLDAASEDPRLARRLRQEQRMLTEGWDPWPLRVERAAPAEDSVTFRRQEGELVEVERFARLTDPDGVGRLFSDLLTAVYSPAGAEAPGELTFYTAWPARATGGERQQVERALERWSREVADYQRAVAALRSYLEAHPRRARPCFYTLFEDLLPASDRALTADEAALVAAVRRGMERVVDVLLVQEGDVHTLNELARKVYDPFGAVVTVDLPGEVTEVEGFRQREGGWQVPPLDLWGAFERLTARWGTPDPAVAWVEANRAFARIDIDAWLREWNAAPPVTAPPPTLPEVRGAVEAELTPAPVYRLRWRPPAAG